MSSQPADSKVVIHARATGSAPILKQPKFKISGHERFSKVVDHLRKQTKSDQLFVYLAQSFSPSLDEEVGALHEAFGVDGRLVVNYATTPAWG